MGFDCAAITLVGVRLKKSDLFVPRQQHHQQEQKKNEPPVENVVPREGLVYDPRVFRNPGPVGWDSHWFEEEGWLFHGYPVHFVLNMEEDDEDPPVYIATAMAKKNGVRSYDHDKFVSLDLTLEQLIEKRAELQRVLEPLGLFQNFGIHSVVEFSW